MNRFFTILLTITFLSSQVYLTVAKHYCGGEYKGVKLSLSGEKFNCNLERKLTGYCVCDEEDATASLHKHNNCHTENKCSSHTTNHHKHTSGKKAKTNIEDTCCETTFFTYVVEEDYHPQEQVETPSDSFVFTPLFVYLWISNLDLSYENSLTSEPPQPPPPTVQEVLSYVQVYRL